MFKNLKDNIKLRLLLYYLFAISIVLLIAFTLIIYVFYKQNLKTIEAQMLVIAQDIDHDIQVRYKNNFKDGFYEERDFHIKNLYIDIVDYENGTFILKVKNHKEHFSIPYQILKQEDNIFFTQEKNNENIHGVLYHSKDLKNVYIVVTTTIADKIYESLFQLIYTFFIIGPLIFIIFMFVGYYVIKNSFKSVKKVIDEVHNIEIGALDKRINRLDSLDEIAELIDTFNSLLKRIEEGFERIKRFSNDVSHELKTPLTVLRGEIELGLRKTRSEKEYEDILHIVLEETKSLQDLIDGLLFLSNKNSVQMQDTFLNVALDEIVLDVLDEHKVNAKIKNIEFNIRGLNSVSLKGNELLLKIMVGNILQNSIKYSHQNSKIDIALYDDGLSIKDYGIGIKEDELKNIFDRFYRADGARSRDEGFGLGLCMVDNIIKIHGLRINVKSEFGKFTEITVLF